MAASRIFSAAWNSPSALITRDRRARLAGNVEADDPQVDQAPTVEDRDDDRQAGPLGLTQEATESEDHEPLVFPDHFDRGPQDHEHQDDDQYRRKDEFLSRHASHPGREGALRE